MSWMLQPHNYAQATQRNLYNVAYRRTGTYKGVGMRGLGQSMGPMYVCPDGTQVFSPANCPGGTPDSAVSTDPLGLQQIQAEIDALFGYTGAGQALPSSTGINWTPYLLLGGGLLLVMLMVRR